MAIYWNIAKEKKIRKYSFHFFSILIAIYAPLDHNTSSKTHDAICSNALGEKFSEVAGE